VKKVIVVTGGSRGIGAGAIDTMTLGLAKELASEGIRVNAVRPGSANIALFLFLSLFHRLRRRGFCVVELQPWQNH